MQKITKKNTASLLLAYFQPNKKSRDYVILDGNFGSDI